MNTDNNVKRSETNSKGLKISLLGGGPGRMTDADSRTHTLNTRVPKAYGLKRFLVRSVVIPCSLVLGVIAGNCRAATVTILPIQISDGTGNFGNASQELFLAATNKIWSQAGITFEYLPFTSIISSDFSTLDDQDEVDSLFALAPGASSTQTTITMWFVFNHFAGYGEANGLGGLGSNRIVIADSVFSEGRLDIIAHELGHLLGLDHDDSGVGMDFLMRSEEDRNTPTSISDIFPDGVGSDRLTPGQIAVALSDP